MGMIMDERSDYARQAVARCRAIRRWQPDGPCLDELYDEEYRKLENDPGMAEIRACVATAPKPPFDEDWRRDVSRLLRGKR